MHPENGLSEGRPLFQVVKNLCAELSPKYGDGEARAMVRIIFENLKGWSPVDMAIKATEPVSEYIMGKIDAVVARLMADEPIQYIFGNAGFYGMKLRVTPDVLIPRPETAELVDWIVDDNGTRKDVRVLDMGTGSGCIAIALKRNLPFADVTAIDNSECGRIQFAVVECTRQLSVLRHSVADRQCACRIVRIIRNHCKQSPVYSRT